MEDCNPDYGYEGYDTEPVDINSEDTGTDVDTGADNPEIGEIEVPVIDIPSPAEIEIHDGTGNLDVSDETLNKLMDKPEETVQEGDSDESGRNISFQGRKVCPTRHGCQGATSCDYSLSDYPF